jgi:hypothetical protein
MRRIHIQTGNTPLVYKQCLYCLWQVMVVETKWLWANLEARNWLNPTRPAIIDNNISTEVPHKQIKFCIWQRFYSRQCRASEGIQSMGAVPTLAYSQRKWGIFLTIMISTKLRIYTDINVVQCCTLCTSMLWFTLYSMSLRHSPENETEQKWQIWSHDL